MKKLLPFLALVLIITFNSCKKCYTCSKQCITCTIPSSAPITLCEDDFSLFGIPFDSIKQTINQSGGICVENNDEVNGVCGQTPKKDLEDLKFKCEDQ